MAFLCNALAWLDELKHEAITGVRETNASRVFQVWKPFTV